MSNKITMEEADEAFNVLCWVKKHYPDAIELSSEAIHNIGVILEENGYDD